MNAVISNISNEIQLGDLVVIALSGNTIDLGFYVGTGRAGTFQYFTLFQLSNYYDRLMNDPVRDFKPTRSYLNSPDRWRIAKYHPDCILNIDAKDRYEKSLKALEILKIK